MSPGRRGRAILFAGVAVVCALASAAVAERYRAAGSMDDGPTRPVVVSTGRLPAGEVLRRRRAGRLLSVRELPERFVPPDALATPADAIGSVPHAAVPAGSYLLYSHLGAERRGDPARGLAKGLRPVEVGVSAAGPLEESGTDGVRVDVLAADEPGSTVNPRVRILARRVPLLGLERRPRGAGTEPDAGGWRATLALDRTDSLAVIEAENFAREIRLLPSGDG